MSDEENIDVEPAKKIEPENNRVTDREEKPERKEELKEEPKEEPKPPRKPRSDKGKPHNFKITAKPEKKKAINKSEGVEIVSGEIKEAKKEEEPKKNDNFNVKLAIGIGALVIAGMLFVMFVIPRNESDNDSNSNSIGGFNVDRQNVM